MQTKREEKIMYKKLISLTINQIYNDDKFMKTKYANNIHISETQRHIII